MNATARARYEDALRAAKLRVTAPRMEILAALDAERAPLSVLQIRKRLSIATDQVTVYRTLEAFKKAGIVLQVHLEHEHAHYELADRAHHHHAVCRICGRVEDLEVPHARNLADLALERSKHFSTLPDYSLEFFGLCKKCARASHTQG